MQNSSNQQSEEWHAQRAIKVTGSRIGAILGHSPWSTREDVMREFIKSHQGIERDDHDNVAMQWGRDHEDLAITKYEAVTGNLVSRSNFVVHPDLPDLIGVSPDGLVDDGLHTKKRLLEVKCPYSKKVPPVVPDHYIDQVQLSMEVLDCDVCDFFYWTPTETKLFHVERDPEWFKATLPIIYEFFEEYQERKDDELIDFVECTDGEAVALAGFLIELRNRIKVLQEEEKDFVSRLSPFVNPDHDTVIGKLYANHVKRKGSINWKECYKDHPEIEKTAEDYRRQPTHYVTYKERN